MNETKRIIVEFGARRQQLTLTDRLISSSKLSLLIGNRFGIKLDNNSTYTLQMYDHTLNEYNSLDDNKQTFDLVRDIKQLHRFRIINKSLQLQKHHLLNNLQSTVGKLHSATKDVNTIQNLVGTLNQNCDILNQLMETRHSKSSLNQPSSSVSSYLLDPSIIQKDIAVTKVQIDNEYDDENFESVSCFDIAPVYTEHPPPPIPTLINFNKQHLSTTDNSVQTRIIPCKYAVRGTCRLGDKCLYLHDETCIQSAREWERRL